MAGYPPEGHVVLRQKASGYTWPNKLPGQPGGSRGTLADPYVPSIPSEAPTGHSRIPRQVLTKHPAGSRARQPRFGWLSVGWGGPQKGVGLLYQALKVQSSAGEGVINNNNKKIFLFCWWLKGRGSQEGYPWASEGCQLSSPIAFQLGGFFFFRDVIYY